MPGVKQLLVAVIGQTGMIEEFLSPRAAAQLTRRTAKESLFQAFAAAVVKEATATEAAAPPTLEKLLVAAIGQQQEANLTPRAVAELATAQQQEALFLAFAADVAKEAKRLRKIVAQREQLAFAWHSDATPPQPPTGQWH